jgi:hypothetical protein
MTQLAIKIGQRSLWTTSNSDDHIVQVPQALGQDAQSGTLTRPGIADREGKTAFAGLLFDAPAEVFVGCDPLQP